MIVNRIKTEKQGFPMSPGGINGFIKLPRQIKFKYAKDTFRNHNFILI